MTAVALLAATALAGCSVGGVHEFRIGTSGTLVSLDPVATTDATSRTIMAQVYPFLVARDPETGAIVPEIAETAAFTGGTQYTVTLSEGLAFANGDALTSSDVLFSVQRMLDLGTESGPAAQLAGIASVAAPDAQTVVFELASANDAGFPAALAGPAGAILDEEVFSADAITADTVIVAGAPFGGPYTIAEGYDASRLTLTANPDYAGAAVTVRAETVDIEFGREPTQLASDLAGGGLDAVYGSLDAEAEGALAEAEGVTTAAQPGTSVRLVGFDLASMPYGTATDQHDATRAAAVRQAVAHVVDREALAALDPGEWAASTAYLPEALGGVPAELAKRYGDGSGGPRPDAARAVLDRTGVSTPVALELHVPTGPAGGEPDAISTALAAQLDDSGLFQVSLVPASGPLTAQVLADGHFPASDYRWRPLGIDPGGYLAPLYARDNVLHNGAGSEQLDTLLSRQATTIDPAARASVLAQAQASIADALPAIPLLQSVDTVYLAPGVSGAAFDGSGFFRFGGLIAG